MKRLIAVMVVTVLLVGPSAAAAAAYDPALIVANIDTGNPMFYTVRTCMHAPIPSPTHHILCVQIAQYQMSSILLSSSPQTN